MVHKTTCLLRCSTGVKRVLKETTGKASSLENTRGLLSESSDFLLTPRSRSELTVPVTSLLQHPGPINNSHTIVHISIAPER